MRDVCRRPELRPKEGRLVSVEPIEHNPVGTDPVEDFDRQLWRDAQAVLNHHVAAPDSERCSACGRAWPCIARTTGERAQAAAFKPWNEVWTARLDLQSATAAAGWRGDRSAAVRNRGLFVV
jgi:hypothetical protein